MDTGSTQDIPAAIFETGHFGAVPHPPTAPLTSWAHELRRRARVLAKDNDPQACWREGFACTRHSGSRVCPVLSKLEPSARSHHFEQQLAEAYRYNPQYFQTRKSKGAAEPRVSGRRQHTGGGYYRSELDNDLALARSAEPLPSDRHHHRRPSLEREEAFYDHSTKGKVRVRRSTVSDDAQVAELYHKGLLYNSSEDVKHSFDLNSIRHSEPTYIIRPAKRARKSAKQRRYHGAAYSLEQPLHLDLSFSDIGKDEGILSFLTSQQVSPEEMLQHASSQDSGDSAPPPLRVIYELAGSQGSVDVDASQPPDLILDSEEFELLSDSDMQDTPYSTQQAATDPSSAAWVMVGDDL